MPRILAALEKKIPELWRSKNLLERIRMVLMKTQERSSRLKNQVKIKVNLKFARREQNQKILKKIRIIKTNKEVKVKAIAKTVTTPAHQAVNHSTLKMTLAKRA
jgi:hypothetical protein